MKTGFLLLILPVAVLADALPLTASTIDRLLLRNPYAHIPAQCYIETSGGTQNACQYCHTDGLARRHFGNNSPQAGGSPIVGDLQAAYAFAALHYPHVANGSINPWRNTLYPEKLDKAVADTGAAPAKWDMLGYIRQDNWSAAYAKRTGDPKIWDAGIRHPWRLFPGLDPRDLPAEDDGFVRSDDPKKGFFPDRGSWNTGWRAINFVPYGIFTPLTGSISGIYIRLPAIFMRDENGVFDRDTYASNLDLIAKAIQDRLTGNTPNHYTGAARSIPVEPGLYPLGTEFAHSLHYVDIDADGGATSTSPFPGTRARRVKEVRYMYKMHPFDPHYGSVGTKEEDAPIRVGETEGWIDNGAGWILAGYIEDARGELRPQTPNELLQCVGCHSGNGPQDDIAYDDFTSGTGNTIDSTWSLARQFIGPRGWREMDAMGYRRRTDAGDDIPGHSVAGDPINRDLNKGEFRHFLETVVGLSLYGDMPVSVENHLARTIRVDRGYSGDWPAIDTRSARAFNDSQKRRQELLRELTAKGDHLDDAGHVHGAFLYPTPRGGGAAARRYRGVVVTQSYDLGKDVFAHTPLTLRYFRTAETAFTHQDGRAYELGEVISDRPIDTDPASVTYGVGISPTLIDTGDPGNTLNNFTPWIQTK